MDVVTLILLGIVPIILFLIMGWVGRSCSHKVEATTELQKTRFIFEKERAQQENETAREKIKLESGNQRLEKELDNGTKLSGMKMEIQKEEIVKEIKLSNNKLKMTAMEGAFKQETLTKEHDLEKETQKLQFELVSKMIDKGFSPVDLAYASVAVSRTLRNDKSDNDLKCLSEIASHRGGFENKQNLPQLTGTSSSSPTIPSRRYNRGCLECSGRYCLRGGGKVSGNMKETSSNRS